MGIFHKTYHLLEALYCWCVMGNLERLASSNIFGGETMWGSKITTRQQMKAWIAEDFKVFRMQHPLAARFTYGENWELFAYLRNLRHLEYYTNKKQKPWDKFLRFYYWLKHRKNVKRTQIDISPNSVGAGFHLQHRGFRHVLSGVKIGKNCEMLPMVLIGKKSPDIIDYHP